MKTPEMFCRFKGNAGVGCGNILIHLMNGSLSSVPILNGGELESKHMTDSSMLCS